MDTFLFSPPINFSEEKKLLLTVTSFETTNSIFIISTGSKCFSITTQGSCTSEGGGEFISKLNEKLEIRSQSYIELHINEVENRGT